MNEGKLKKTLIAASFIFLAGLTAAWRPVQPLHGDDPPGQVDVEEITFQQKIGAQIPLDLNFLDETGQQVQLSDYFGLKPAILLFAYYECPMLCPLVLEDLTHSLQGLSFTAGKDFQVITVSLDPEETPELAAAKKEAYLKQYGRESADHGWHFLTGKPEDIEELARVVGLEYAYDEAADEYAHPSGLVILTPHGRISRYIFGLDFAPRDLRLGLVEAADGKIGSTVDQLFLLCYRYDPETGKYSLFITNVLRIAAIASALALFSLVGLMVRREQHAHNAAGGASKKSHTVLENTEGLIDLD
jgi:protein SCO1/2